ncbi:transcriptional regulator [Cryobacterium mesophilum]|uniref:FMN-binding negative transcriptional regulator n=1 Tax=Terrimesophilobacter mesophilus TaxID=433647 RepID=A0A4R8VA23_9MICO|nr:FMN-binding negative transcriptional regulator [Terrimesophilobacter mesophilus]MBB5632356.1 transcriptional regulator [Terrimesophilobacter mesophilus]TFB79196.1 FMN-binding negative transcriptional regulator [Terrimesophilobacter mesophilus]
MMDTGRYVSLDENEVKRLIRDNPWGTIVTDTAKGLIASHYPMLLENDGSSEEDAGGISIVSHVGKPDDDKLELGRHEALVIIQGPNGYISPGWYDKINVPTWNHVTAHLYGVPEILSDDENWAVLERLTHHFEDRMPHPVLLEHQEKYAREQMAMTAGFRIRVTRFEARLKLSQNRPQVADRIIDELDHGDNYRQPALADEMRRVHTPKATA